MHATMFGNVTALVARLYGALKSLYQTKMKDLKDFSALHAVPKNFSLKLHNCIYFLLLQLLCKPPPLVM